MSLSFERVLAELGETFSQPPLEPAAGTDSGLVNAYVYTHSGPLVATLSAGTLIRFTPAHTNTGASTINVNGTGVVAVVGVTNAALVGGELSSLGPVMLQYNGTAWQIIATTGTTPIFGATGAGAESGAVNAYVYTHNSYSLPATLAVGALIRFTPLNTNTGASTLNADGSGAVAIIRANGAALTGGELSSLGPVVLQSTGSQWQIVSTAGAQPGFERTAAEIANSVVPVNYIYDPFDLNRYGADRTGVATSDTAMASAISVCGSIGGTIRAPAGTYKFATQINLTSKHSITIEGDGGPTNNANAATTFTYSGATAPFVILASSFGCSLRKIVLTTSNVSFTGFFIATSTTSGNPFMCSLEDIYLSCVSQCGGASLDTAIGFLCKRVIFDHGKPCLVGQSSAGGSFSNIVDVVDCQFQQATGSFSIGYLGGQWNIIGNDFEPGGDGVMAAIQNNTTTPCTGVVISGNFIADATSASSPVVLSGTGIQIAGNFINAGNAGGAYPSFTNVGPAITLTTARGVTIQGNSFSNCNVGLTFGDANCKAIRISENYLTNCNTLVGAYNTNAPYDLQFNPNYNASAAVQDFIPASGALFGNFAINGFEVTQNGIIRMWGQKTVTAGTPLAITFATEVGRAFPNNCYQADCWFGAAPGAAATGTYTSSTSATGTTLNVAGGTATNTVNWQAVGN